MTCNPDWDDELDDDDNDNVALVGSCDRCECDVYEHEAYVIDGDLYCDQCTWALREART